MYLYSGLSHVITPDINVIPNIYCPCVHIQRYTYHEFFNTTNKQYIILMVYEHQKIVNKYVYYITTQELN